MQPVFPQIGTWFLAKWRGRLAECGDAQHVARQMRKQGVPLEVALATLAPRRNAQELPA